jgi:hypothetical protein
MLKVKSKSFTMKTTIQSLVMLCIVAGLVSCEKIKNLADVEFDTTMDTNLNIAVDQPMKSTLAGYTYEASATLDPTSDPEVKKYADKIKKYDITSLTAKVISVSKENVKLLQGTFFKIADATDNTKWVLTEDFDVVVGNSYTLGNDNGEWAVVQRILGRNAEFTVTSEGSATENNITIIMKVSIGAKVTANPL